MIQILNDYNEKQRTRALYEEAFDDPAAYVDYYYTEKLKDNIVITMSGETGELQSMLHLNPYRLSVCKAEIPSYYVVAVATSQRFRRQGCMRKVLHAAFDVLYDKGIPFVFLLPVDEAIYTPFGFETVCDFVPFEKRLPYDEVRRSFDVFCVRDAVYLQREKAEDALRKNGIGEVLPANPVMMVKITNEEAFRALPGASECRTAAQMCDYLRQKKVYFTEEV